MEIIPLFNQTLDIEVATEADVGHVRRLGKALGDRGGMDEMQRERVGIIATEAARNIVRHAGRGRILLNYLRFGDRICLDIVAIDKGPGMRDLKSCMCDGVSTGGTAGNGLGAIRRLATEFDIWTELDAGTLLFARIATPGALPDWLQLAGLSVAKPGNTVCGDVWSVKMTEDEVMLLVADGLGHGSEAATASRRAATLFQSSLQPVPELLGQMHEALRHTRGAAVAITHVQRRGSSLNHAGVGNIGGSIVNASKRNGILSQHGTVGLSFPELRPMLYNWNFPALLVLYSDGLHSRWDLQDHPGLNRAHPGIVAALLYRDQRRLRDDVTVVVLRRRPPPPERISA